MNSPLRRRRRNWVADRRLTTKLLTLLGVLLLLAAAVGGLAIVRLGSVASAAESIYSEGAVPLDAQFDQHIARVREGGSDTELLDRYVAAVEDYRAFRDTTIVPASRAMDPSVDVAPMPTRRPPTRPVGRR